MAHLWTVSAGVLRADPEAFRDLSCFQMILDSGCCHASNLLFVHPLSLGCSHDAGEFLLLGSEIAITHAGNDDLLGEVWIKLQLPQSSEDFHPSGHNRDGSGRSTLQEALHIVPREAAVETFGESHEILGRYRNRLAVFFQVIIKQGPDGKVIFKSPLHGCLHGWGGDPLEHAFLDLTGHGLEWQGCSLCLDEDCDQRGHIPRFEASFIPEDEEIIEGGFRHTQALCLGDDRRKFARTIEGECTPAQVAEQEKKHRQMRKNGSSK